VARHEITLAAPFESIVAERLHNPGEQVAANDTLLELYDPQSLIVIAHVPIEAAPTIQAGQPVAIEIGSTRVDGRVDGLSAAVTPDTLTLPVRIALSAALRPPLVHAAVLCRILLARHEDAVLIPRTALARFSAGDEAVVMVVTGTHAQRRAVRLGLRDATQVEVIDGLDADERIVADGGFALPEDATLSIVAD
jgi:multidrug efflux pump subunit AcrA (membrane-fusion protein)